MFRVTDTNDGALAVIAMREANTERMGRTLLIKL